MQIQKKNRTIEKKPTKSKQLTIGFFLCWCVLLRCVFQFVRCKFGAARSMLFVKAAVAHFYSQLETLDFNSSTHIDRCAYWISFDKTLKSNFECFQFGVGRGMVNSSKVWTEKNTLAKRNARDLLCSAFAFFLFHFRHFESSWFFAFSSFYVCIYLFFVSFFFLFTGFSQQ